MRKKVITVLGARPQFIKASVVSAALAKADIEEIIVHTGQHFDKNMSDIFFEEMGIPQPKYNLNIHSLPHGAMTGRMMEELEKILIVEKPDMALVYGDTNSTLAGAMAAKKLNIKIAHIEAGLRAFTYSLPEEMNRVLTDRISDLLFCPTKVAIENLKDEGFDHFKNVHYLFVGDVMYDVALTFSKNNQSKILDTLHLQPGKYILSTIHRNENTDSKENLSNIINALNEINKEYKIVLPIHPRTKQKLTEWNIAIEFTTIEPVGYLDMIKLLENCRLVISDSGGIQKEAYFFQKNCINLRNETEWTDLIDAGANINAGNKKEHILSAYSTIKNYNTDFSQKIFGNGDAATIIVREMMKLL